MPSVVISVSPDLIDLYFFLHFSLWGFFFRLYEVYFFGSSNGEVEEPHGAQPVIQGAQERDQEASEASPHLNQRGIALSIACI